MGSSGSKSAKPPKADNKGKAGSKKNKDKNQRAATTAGNDSASPARETSVEVKAEDLNPVMVESKADAPKTEAPKSSPLSPEAAAPSAKGQSNDTPKEEPKAETTPKESTKNSNDTTNAVAEAQEQKESSSAPAVKDPSQFPVLMPGTPIALMTTSRPKIVGVLPAGSSSALKTGNDSADDIRASARHERNIRDFNQWSVEEVVEWVRDDINLPQYAEAFSSNIIYGALLPKLSIEKLQDDLNVDDPVHREAFMRGVRKLTGEPEPEPPKEVPKKGTLGWGRSMKRGDARAAVSAIKSDKPVETVPLKDESSDKGDKPKGTLRKNPFASIGRAFARKSTTDSQSTSTDSAVAKKEDEKTDKRKRAVSNAFAERMEAVGAAVGDKSRTKEGLAEVEAMISQVESNSSSLTEVNLTNNGTLLLMEKAAREAKLVQLAKAFSKNTHVTTVLMVNCAADDAFAIAFSEALKSNKTIEVVNLESNVIAGAGVIAIGGMLPHNSTLRELKLINQKQQIPTEGEEALLKGLQSNETVTKLNIDIRDATVKEGVEKRLAANMDRIRKKRFEEGGSAPATLSPLQKKIMSIVTDNFAEEELDLTGDMEFTRLKEEEKIAVAAGLANNSRIRIAKLVKVQLRDSFAVALGKSLETNSKLEILSLDSNSISGPGIVAIAQGLKANTTLKELKLQGQSATATTEAEEALATMLETNNTLLKLGLQLRSSTARDKVEKALRRNNDLMRQKRLSSAPATPSA